MPGLHYREAHYQEIRSVAKLKAFHSAGTFYVLRSDWQTEKLLVEPYVHNTEGPGFYIAQRYGGPSLCYSLYSQWEEDGRLFLGRGTIDYYPFYYSIQANRRLDPNPSLKGFYVEVARFMKEGGSRITGNRRTVWLTRDAVKLLSSKQASAPEPWGDAAATIT